LQNAFDMMVSEFNQTAGLEQGIIVEAMGLGNMGNVETSIRASLIGDAGSLELPNIFSAFPDTAYLPQRMGMLLDLEEILTPAQLGEYFGPFIERGRIGGADELRIMPVAMSAEVMLVNETAWEPFAADTGVTFDHMRTMEGLAEVAQAYYNWSGGYAFWGRDAMANMFIIGSRAFGTEIFEVFQYEDYSLARININMDAMRRFWNYYYTPFISGYFGAAAQFRTDDVRVGDLVALVGSTAAAAFFPHEVSIDGVTHNINARALPPPVFAGATEVMIMQGAGKAVIYDTHQKNYASVAFLRWLTEPAQNLRFSAASGRLPVRYDVMNVDLVRETAEETGVVLTDITYQTLSVAIDAIRRSELYNSCAFTGAVQARGILTNNLRNKARADRATVLDMVAEGTPRAEAIAYMTADERFHAWVNGLYASLVAAVTPDWAEE
jgi:multiple sugar transport system substrate-binding protein